ncbi:hypothetical protein RND71_025267 [Anisodus tanguticus]|uniref:Uncharacterized protein n=1 Tax=Anisodus tanguticus TaxID=243964 RepID=A0AAE1RR59_9SOLA|nr:hypothetical protein RND71_025267 [Anisodus tanguticus]
MDGLHEKMKLPTISSGLSEQYKGHLHRTNAGAAEEQEASIDARGPAPGLAALQMDGHVQLINAGAGVKKKASTGVRGLVPGSAAHVRGKLLGDHQVTLIPQVARLLKNVEKINVIGSFIICVLE